MTDPVARLNAALEGRYAIERELGEGGMATVYLADDLKHQRKVALKVLKPELAAVVGAERFLAEITTTANLTHPHILPLHDSGEADGFLFYVMPRIEGESLRERIDREKQLSVDDSVAITQKVAGALDYAHQNGVVHRDIKPGNILLSAQSEPLVADFGIALAVAQAGAGRITETGLSLGTPHYMSPEQATGDRDVDPRSDVYALGCVLYEMLAGQPPFSATTAQAVLVKILTADAPSITSERRTVPPYVGHALARALEKLPADRFASAAEFAAALADPSFTYEARRSPAAVPEPPGRTTWVAVPDRSWNRLTVTFASLFFATALAFGWSLLRPEPPQLVTRQVLSTQGWAGSEVPVGRYVALAPDGSSMILPIDNQLALKMRASTEIVPIPGTEQARDVVYSPDGRWIAYSVVSDLFKRPLVGGSPIRIAEDLPTTTGLVGLSWLDDGTILYEQYNLGEERIRRVVRISEDGGEPMDIVFGLEEEMAIVWVHGLPGARGTLVVACPGTTCPLGAGQLHIVDLEDLSSELLFEQVLRAWYAPTGHIVYVRTDGAVLAQPFDPAALELTGSSIPLFAEVRTFGGNSGFPDMQLGADGTLMYVEGSGATTGGQGLVVVDLEGNETPVALAPRNIAQVGWSPDGQSVVYASDNQIFTYNVALRTTPRQVTFEGTNNTAVFSPDGTRVAFRSFIEGRPQLVAKDLHNDSPPTAVMTMDGFQIPTQWPADTLIIFEQGLTGQRDLGMVSLSDPDGVAPAPYLASEANLRYMALSPDGTLAAYSSSVSGQFEVYIRSFPDPGEPTLVSQAGGVVPFWSPDGTTLYYVRPVGTSGVFYAARLQRDPVPVVLSIDSLFSVAGVSTPFPSSGLHPDGDRFILAQSVGAAEAGSEQVRLILVQNFFEELKRLVPN